MRHGNWVIGLDGTYIRRGNQSAYLKSDCNRMIREIEAQFHRASLELEIKFRRDQRRILRCATISQTTYSIATAWLKVIPVVGGYIGLLNKALLNPGGGTWEVMRSAYGRNGNKWNLWGSMANGVSSPLTVDGASGYNLGSGSPTLFQTNQRMKCPGCQSLRAFGILRINTAALEYLSK